MRNRGCLIVAGALLTGCGGGSSTVSSPSPSPTAIASPTTPTAGEARHVLRELANEEEAYFTDNQKYLAFKAIVPTDFAPVAVPGGLTVGVVVTGKDAFCAVAAVNGTTQAVFYVSDRGGIVGDVSSVPPVCRTFGLTLIR